MPDNGAQTTPTASATATNGPALTPTSIPTEVASPTTEPPATSAWLSTSSQHFDFYYLPNTPAARDIEQLKALTEQSLQEAAAPLQTTPSAHMAVFFVNRIFWQGGATWNGNELLLSYTDPEHSYNSIDMATVLRHEITHALVSQIVGADKAGGFLGEGAAVWAAGGHYRREPVEVLAATLLSDNANLYVPLASLDANFGQAQHEVAYIEAGSFVKYLTQNYGLDRFKQYLASPHDPSSIYGKDLSGLEQEWRAWLETVPISADDNRAVALRVRYYDLMRRYESALDTAALSAGSSEPSQWGSSVVSTFSHPATAPLNVTIERSFVAAGAALWSGALGSCSNLLDNIAASIASVAN